MSKVLAEDRDEPVAKKKDKDDVTDRRKSQTRKDDKHKKETTSPSTSNDPKYSNE